MNASGDGTSRAKLESARNRELWQIAKKELAWNCFWVGCLIAVLGLVATLFLTSLPW